ncbi:MAG: protein-L-isoaspartate(D-aspartate) O-methyltransferase [Devosiaceae bacterium]|nr:protein-L-isoaspartate(D-aspartate) O-methyltransferase [Devosiaceae bacterium MH13]
MDEETLRRANLVLKLRSIGVTDHAVLSAFEATPRHAFAPKTYASDAYADRLIPIACGQTMEAPTVLATLLTAASLSKTSSVLEIGAGSGYLTALLARLCRRVIGLERFRTLTETARANVQQQGITNAEIILTDGTAGWPPAGPYDAVIVTASVEQPMQLWLDQLVPDGKLIVPLGAATAPQRWISVANSPQGLQNPRVLGTTFAAPLTPGLARAL